MKIVDPRRLTVELETVDFRLTREEILMVNMGLRPCVWSVEYAKQRGSYPKSDYPHLRPREGKFDQRFLDYILATWKVTAQWIDGDADSHRVRLDPIAIAILAFLVRVAAVQIRHGHVVSQVSFPYRVGKRLGHKLENERRRALRKAKASGQEANYARLAKQWHSFQPWMRSNLLYCRCHRPNPTHTRKRNLLYIAECEKVARKVIEEYELKMPTATELRKLVKLAIRYSRRSRLGVGVRTLLKGDDASFFVWGRFLQRRLLPLTEIN